jgi:pilus assembly protein CpaF
MNLGPDLAEEDRLLRIKTDLHKKLISEMDLSAIGSLSEDELRDEVRRGAEQLCRQSNDLLSLSEREKLISEVLDETFGIGPLEILMRDPTISDILVNGPKCVYVERRGRLSRSEVVFNDEKHLIEIVRRIVSRVGRRVDETSPLCDARLPDGSRVNAVIPPLALDGTLLSIRRASKSPLQFKDLVDKRAITPEMVDFLSAATRARVNMVVSGGTGSGKTTMMNAISRNIDPTERIVTIEDAAELQLQQPHVVSIETRPPSLEGGGEITQRDLLKNALRMRPDRIIVGEVRGGEAYDMLQAMNTGHDGSMSTVHANTPRDALARIENMVLTAAVGLPLRAIRTQIVSALDLVVQIERMRDGIRRIQSVIEVIGLEGETITTQELFTYKYEGENRDGTLRGSFVSSAYRPHFLDRIAEFGLERRFLELLGIEH